MAAAIIASSSIFGLQGTNEQPLLQSNLRGKMIKSDLSDDIIEPRCDSVLVISEPLEVMLEYVEVLVIFDSSGGGAWNPSRQIKDGYQQGLPICPQRMDSCNG